MQLFKNLYKKMGVNKLNKKNFYTIVSVIFIVMAFVLGIIPINDEHAKSVSLLMAYLSFGIVFLSFRMQIDSGEELVKNIKENITEAEKNIKEELIKKIESLEDEIKLLKK